MSQGFVHRAIRDFLQTALSKGKFDCEAQDGPEPPNSFTGTIYIAVHPGPMSGTPDGRRTYRREEYSPRVTVSQKLGWLPIDRRGSASLYGEGEYVSTYRNEVVAQLQLGSNSDAICSAASALIEMDEGAPTTKVQGLLRLASPVAPPTKQMGKWFGFDDTQEYFGVSVTMEFSGIWRIRNPVLMT